MQGAKQKASEEQSCTYQFFHAKETKTLGSARGRWASQNTSGSQLEPLEDYTLGAWSKQPVGRQTLEKIQSKPESVSLVQLRWSAPPICLEEEKNETSLEKNDIIQSLYSFHAQYLTCNQVPSEAKRPQTKRKMDDTHRLPQMIQTLELASKKFEILKISIFRKHSRRKQMKRWKLSEKWHI